MKNIALPLGVSDNAVPMITYAIDMAKHSGANLYILDSYNPSYPNIHLVNLKEVVDRSNFERLKEHVKGIDTQGISIQMVAYEDDLLRGLKELDQTVGIDLIISGATPNSDSEAIYLGPTAGRVVKKTAIPVWIVPDGAVFSPPKKSLFAFKKGKIEENRALAPVHYLQQTFGTAMELLLVKTPGKARSDFQIDHEIVELSDHMTSTENGTVYQGVLEHFREVKPDLLTVFARNRGFFEQLIESDVVYKKDFYASVPLLVLKHRRE